MNRKAIVLALIFSLGVAFFIQRQMQRDSGHGDTKVVSAPAPAVLTERVVVAKKRIPPRTRLEKGKLGNLFEIRDIPVSSVPDLAFTEVERLAERYSAVTILPGDIMIPERVLDQDAVPNLARAIPLGKRAVTIAVTRVTSVGGFVQQRDYVDVIATLRPRDGEPISKIVLQDILVLAVGTTFQYEGSVATTAATIQAAKMELVTLAVTPDELERLMFLDSGATFRLVLKNPNDKIRQIVTKGATERTILTSIGYIPPEERAEQAPPRLAIQEPDTGRVKIQYGSSRREELYKYGSSVDTWNRDFYKQPAPKPVTVSGSRGQDAMEEE